MAATAGKKFAAKDAVRILNELVGLDQSKKRIYKNGGSLYSLSVASLFEY